MKRKIYCSAILLFCAIPVFAAVINCDNVLPKNSLEEQILSLLNKWRNGRVQTNLFPLPTLKSISINGIQSSYEGRGIKIVFSIGDMKLTGMNNFSVEKIDVITTADSLDIYAKISIPILLLHADKYELRGRAYYVYPLKGSGQMKVLLLNNKVALSIRFVNVDGILTSIQDFSLKYNIGNIEANLENSSWPISNVLNSEGVKILENYNDDINNALREYAVPYANEFLAKIKPKEFLDTIADISLNSYVIEENYTF